MCKGQTKNGKPCKNKAAEYCYLHKPAQPTEENKLARVRREYTTLNVKYTEVKKSFEQLKANIDEITTNNDKLRTTNDNLRNDMMKLRQRLRDADINLLTYQQERDDAEKLYINIQNKMEQDEETNKHNLNIVQSKLNVLQDYATLEEFIKSTSSRDGDWTYKRINHHYLMKKFKKLKANRNSIAHPLPMDLEHETIKSLLARI